MPAAVKRAFGRFADDTSGGIAIIFSLVLVPALIIVSLAIDYGRALKLKSTIQNASDAAVYAAAPRLLGSNDELILSLRQNLDANLPKPLQGIKFELQVAPDRQSMNVAIDTKIETSLVAMVGIDAMDVSVKSTAKLSSVPAHQRRKGGQPPVEQREIERELGRFAGGGVSSRRLSGSDLEALRNSEEMRRAAAALEEQLKAAMGRGGAVDLGELQRLLQR